MISAGINHERSSVTLYFQISLMHMRPSFFQPEGVLTEVRERIVEINPSEHPGAASLQTLNMQ